MRIASLSSVISRPSDHASKAPKNRIRAIAAPGEDLAENARFTSPSAVVRLRIRAQAVAGWVQAACVTARQLWKQRAETRRLARDILRLEELAPHLLDDIGIRKLECGDFEVLSAFPHEVPARPRQAQDIPHITDNFPPPTRPKRSDRSRGKAA